MCACTDRAGSAEPCRSQPASIGTAPALLLVVLPTVLFLHPPEGAPGARGCRGGPDPPICQPLPRRVTGLGVVSTFPALSLQAKSCVRCSGGWNHRGLPCRHLGPLAGGGRPEPAGAAVSGLAESQGRLPLSVAAFPGERRGTCAVPAAGGFCRPGREAGVRGEGVARSRGWLPARGKQLLCFPGEVRGIIFC